MPSSTEPAQPFQPFSRANYYSTLYSNTPIDQLPIRFNTCMCFTYNDQKIYKPHSGLGRVGTTSSAYQAQRKRI